MNIHLLYFFIFMGGFIATAIATGILVWLVKKKHLQFLLDKPNARSNHKKPVPRGGGLAIVTVIVSAILLLSFLVNKDFYLIKPLFLSLAILAVISFADDIKSLPAIVRFAAHIMAVVVGVQLLYNVIPGYRILIHSPLPLWLDIVCVSIIWLWFINLYNFMDGIDGITSTETIFICLGICISAILVSLGKGPVSYSLVIAASALGFLVWNWHPSRIIMGDVGSITLGFLLGWLLLFLAASGHIFAALIFPAYYLADSTITLVRRVAQGEKPWQAHSEHYYQQAVRKGGKTHSVVVWWLVLLNSALLGLGLWAVTHKNHAPFAFICSYLLVFALLYFFQKPSKSKK